MSPLAKSRTSEVHDMMTTAMGALTAIAQFAAEDGAAEPAAGSGFFTIFLLGALFAGFYFLMVRPQRRRMKDAEQRRNAVEVGHEVRTIGGIIGTVTELNDDTAKIRLEDGTIMKIVRRALAERVEDSEE